MAKNKQNNFVKWIILLGIVFFILAGFGLFKNSSKLQQKETTYQTYQNSIYGFSIDYPKAWEILKDTQIFENGDAIAFGIKGTTQKENTELTDGAQVAVSKPFTINTSLKTWIKDNFNNESILSKFTLSKYPYDSVYECSNIGCMTYYFTLVNNKVYGIAVFMQDPDKDKMVYENTTLYMLKSLQFDNPVSGTISKEDAIAKVKTLPEVIDYLKRIPNGQVLVNGEENNAYLVQVYELLNNHTATLNWYTVDKTTGAVEKQF